jgi:UDP-N-acetylglucosamine 2-epimerase (non-hydrolysing)
VVVCGDVNSSLACALVAAKARIPVAHLEAGLRSFDRSMPEEVNRVVVDAVSTWLLTPSADADENLRREGAHPARIRRVGNIMVDSLLAALRRPAPRPGAAERAGVGDRYGVVTLHRPGLVDDGARFRAVVDALGALSEELPLLFPLHPRTRARLAQLDVRVPQSLHLLEPLGYDDFVHCEAGARLVLTDSGGVQEETTCLGVPCLTLRDTTERPVTVALGTNTVIGVDPARIVPAARDALTTTRLGRRPPLWDGATAGRVVDALLSPPPTDVWAPGSPLER